MKEALSREKLNFLHEALDRELESVDAGVLASSVYSNRSKDRPHQDSKPPVTNSSSHSELEQLQKKLSYLEKKMEGIKLDEEEASSHSLISETEIADYRPSAEKVKVQFQKSVLQSKDEGEHQLRSVDKRSPKGKEAQRKASSRKHPGTSDETEETPTPLKRKYEVKETIASNHNSASKKPSSRKLQSQLTELERQIKKAENNLNLSRKSISQQSVRSMGRRNLSLQKGSAGRQPHSQKSDRIELLEKEVATRKQQNRKLRARIKVLELIETEYAKLKVSFEKSEHIRKQQKLLLDGYKQKLQQARKT